VVGAAAAMLRSPSGARGLLPAPQLACTRTPAWILAPALANLYRPRAAAAAAERRDKQAKAGRGRVSGSGPRRHDEQPDIPIYSF
jgi:hypothetical protein